jgi:hypothetical protein
MRTDEPTLLLKFSGAQLDVRSVPIYELGETLMAMQRIVHKTYLFENERLKKHAQLTQDERMRLSLQISERRKSSDVYALIPFLTDSNTQEYLATLLKIGLGSLAKYAWQMVLGEKSKSKPVSTSVRTRDANGSLLVGAIYGEVVQITNHIYNIGGIEKVELIPSSGLRIDPIEFTGETQKYVRSIANATYLGPQDEIVGEVHRLHPNRLVAEIKLEPARIVKVRMDDEAFNSSATRQSLIRPCEYKDGPL